MTPLPEMPRTSISAFEAHVEALKEYAGAHDAFVHHFARTAETVFRLGEAALPLGQPGKPVEAFACAMDQLVAVTVGYLAAHQHIKHIEMDVPIRRHVEVVETFLTNYALHIQQYGVAVATNGDLSPARSIFEQARARVKTWHGVRQAGRPSL